MIPADSISAVFEIIEGLPPDNLLEPSDWTLDLDATENYVSFAKLQRKVYQVVKLIRCPDSQRWLVDELCPMLG